MVLAVDVPLIAAWTGVLATVVVALLEIRSAAVATKVQRTIDIHRDLCAGEVGAARRRLSSFMWAYGLESSSERLCYSPTREEIDPQLGKLGSYRPGDSIPTGVDDSTPLDDLYVVLWCFERIDAGLAGGALHEAMAKRLLARHAVWWDEATRHIKVDDIDYIGNLRRLSKRLESPALRSRLRLEFVPSAGD